MKIKFAQTIRNYDRKNLGKDLVAGLIIMAVSIPISMGYAQIAGLPTVYGLYGSVFPILLFALFSTSPQFIFGVDAAPAALIGAAPVSYTHLNVCGRTNIYCFSLRLRSSAACLMLVQIGAYTLPGTALAVKKLLHMFQWQ